MTFRSTLAKGALTAVAGVMAFSTVAAVPSFASAQPYGGSYYDPCRRDQTNRGTAGALIGGALGAAIGSNAAARNARTEGALLGGALGAALGAGVGNNSAACRSGYAPRSSYYNNGYYGDRYGSGYGYGSSYGYNDGRAYGSRYVGDRYDDDYAYDRYGNTYRMADRPAGADGCTLAESPIYLPDGRVQKRFVRVCQDGSGRYQVVD